MCFKCDTNMTQEEWDHYCLKIISNARYGMTGVVTWGRDQPYEVLYPRPKSRFGALNLMVQKTKGVRLAALYERLVRKYWCSHQGHDSRPGYQQGMVCLNCNKKLPLDLSILIQATNRGIEAFRKFGITMNQVTNNLKEFGRKFNEMQLEGER